MKIVLSLVLFSTIANAGDLDNPAIDMAGYLDVSHRAAEHRARHRVSEADFLRLSATPGTVILDARSREKYDELHVKGAINLPFPDIAIDSLETILPDKNTRILIYCNNNFQNAEKPFPAKLASASLNLATYIALYNYGYRNVYELAPLIDLEKSILPFEGGAAGVREWSAAVSAAGTPASRRRERDARAPAGRRPALHSM